MKGPHDYSSPADWPLMMVCTTISRKSVHTTNYITTRICVLLIMVDIKGSQFENEWIHNPQYKADFLSKTNHLSLYSVHHSSSWSCVLSTCCSGLFGSFGAPAIGGICCGSSSGSVLSSSSACSRKLCSTPNTRASATKGITVGCVFCFYFLQCNAVSCLFIIIVMLMYFALCSSRCCYFCWAALCTEKIFGSNPGHHCQSWLWYSQVSSLN